MAAVASASQDSVVFFFSNLEILQQKEKNSLSLPLRSI